MRDLVDAQALSYRVGGKALVSDVSLRLAAGRVSVMVGPNGAGKSTLVKLLSGELRAAEGGVRYGGEPVAAIPGWRLACLRAVLPQASRLAFPFTVREVARLGIDGIGRGLTRRDREAILSAALARADIGHLAERSYQSLSGGEQQRAQFARILSQLGAGRTVAEAQTLILDEPIASLDLRHQLALLDTAAGLAGEGVAVLAVLHDLNLASAYADTLLVMSEGRIVAEGPPADVLTDAIIADVFGVDLRVGEMPAGGRPFILPRSPRPQAASSR